MSGSTTLFWMITLRNGRKQAILLRADGSLFRHKDRVDMDAALIRAFRAGWKTADMQSYSTNPESGERGAVLDAVTVAAS